MRQKKLEEDEMLITHFPREDKSKNERNERESGATGRNIVERLRRRMAAASSPADRAAVVAEAEARFGADVARQIQPRVPDATEGTE